MGLVTKAGYNLRNDMDTPNEKEADLPNVSPKKTLDELKALSKEELLKMVFDRPTAKVKEKGHAQYAL